MNTAPILTERLEIIPATPEILTQDRASRAGLGRLLNATIPRSWPPPLFDDAAIAEFTRIIVDGSDPNFRLWYWILPGPDEGVRTLIGSGGLSS